MGVREHNGGFIVERNTEKRKTRTKEREIVLLQTHLKLNTYFENIWSYEPTVQSYAYWFKLSYGITRVPTLTVIPSVCIVHVD